MAIDILDANFGGQLAIGNKDDALFAVQGKGAYMLVVFCAKEVVPPSQAFLDRVTKRGVRLQHLPLLDQYSLSPPERLALSVQVPAIAAAYKHGERVLITCNQGVNRSALVAALVLDEVYRYGGAEALRIVRARRVRGRPLENGYYATVLEQRPPRTTGMRATL